jgi:hypothetical protein
MTTKANAMINDQESRAMISDDLAMATTTRMIKMMRFVV